MEITLKLGQNKPQPVRERVRERLAREGPDDAAVAAGMQRLQPGHRTDSPG